MGVNAISVTPVAAIFVAQGGSFNYIEDKVKLITPTWAQLFLVFTVYTLTFVNYLSI